MKSSHGKIAMFRQVSSVGSIVVASEIAVYLVLLIINTLYAQLFVLIQNVQHATVLSGNKLKAKERELQSKRDQLDGTKKRVAKLQ